MWWRVKVRERGDEAKVCASGPAYQIAASGMRAKHVVEDMMRYGLSS
jgi:hypothetical protein